MTNDAVYAEQARRPRQYGWGHKYEVGVDGGRNSRLDEMQAAVLVEKLVRLDDWNAERWLIAERYTRALSSVPLELPPLGRSEYVAHIFVVRTRQRDALKRHLSEDGIGSEIYYPIADHQQRFADPAPKPVSLPVTEAAAATVLSLPCYPGLTQEQQSIVVDSITTFYAARPPG